MRTKLQADAIYKENVPLITGKPLLPFFTLCLGDTINGMPKAALFQEEDGSTNLLGLDIVPKRYWQSLSEKGIVYLITQEYVHGLSIKHIPEALAELEVKVLDMRKEFSYESSENQYLREVKLRELYELQYGFIVPMLNWKLHIDYAAIKHLRDKSLPTEGGLEVLESEFEEEGRQAKPESRRIARQWLVKMRIFHVKMLLENTEQSNRDAATLRNYMERQSIQILSAHSTKSTPSTV